MERIAVFLAALALSGSLLCGAAAGSDVLPSVEITGGTSGICDNSGGSLNPNIPTFLNVYQGASDAATMSVAGVGVVATESENQPSTGSFPGTFGLLPSAYMVPPGTAITVEILTYFGPDQTGGISFRSRIVFACDTGEILSLVSGPPVTPAPTLGAAGLAVLTLVLALAGLGSLAAART